MASEIKVDTISEKTSANGVAIDSVALKDGGATLTAPLILADGSASAPTITNTGDTNCGLLFSAADTMAFSAGGTSQFTMADGVIAPVTDNDVDLGTASLEFKDGYFDGTLHCDVIDLAGTEYTSIASTMNALTDVSMDITNFADSILIQTESDGSAPSTGTLSSASNNVGIGKNVFSALTSGQANICIGQTGQALTTGNHNTFVGHNAGASVTTGTYNTGIGKGALDGFDTESHNTSVGDTALGGPIAGGEYNTAVGKESAKVVTSGDYNTSMGYYSALSLTTGSGNTFIGRSAGNSTQTGDNNVMVGALANTDSIDGEHQICIGHDFSSPGNNNFAFGKASNVVYNAFITNASWTRSSDVRKKRNINDQELGLDFINDLRTVTFQWKPSNEFPKEWNDYSEENNMDTNAIMHGFIAQEVKEALDKHANEKDKHFGGWSVHKDGMQLTSREMFVIPLIKAVQELSAEVKELKAKLEAN